MQVVLRLGQKLGDGLVAFAWGGTCAASLPLQQLLVRFKVMRLAAAHTQDASVSTRCATLRAGSLESIPCHNGSNAGHAPTAVLGQCQSSDADHSQNMSVHPWDQSYSLIRA